MSRAQCIVIKGDRILMVKHRQDGEDWWCLPGGGILHGEAPAVAAIRELSEECCVEGMLIRSTSVVTYGAEDHHYTYLVEIGDQAPSLGDDPDKEPGKKVLADLAWLSLEELSEVDRVYLWTAGLLSIPEFGREVLSWPRIPGLPGQAR